jgi:hypothetical protein
VLRRPIEPAVDSRRLENSYLESVPTSEFVVTTDIRRAPEHEHLIDSVLLGSARNGHSRDSGVLPSCSNSGRSPQLDIGYLLWALDTQNLGV